MTANMSMTESAAKIADFLAGHPKVARVMYPHHRSHPQYELAKRQMAAGSTLVAFEVKGGKEAAFRTGDNLAIIITSNNLGDAKSIIAHPATTTHQRFDEATRAFGQPAFFGSCPLYHEASYVFGHITGPAFVDAERDDFERSVILAGQDVLDDGCFSRDRLSLDVGVAMLAEVAEHEMDRRECRPE